MADSPPRIYVDFVQADGGPIRTSLGPYFQVEIDGVKLFGVDEKDADGFILPGFHLATMEKSCWKLHDGSEDSNLRYRIQVHTKD